jgi:hypothetical protein
MEIVFDFGFVSLAGIIRKKKSWLVKELTILRPWKLQRGS